jgi:phage shock protein A
VLLKRFWNILAAKLNKLLGRAENPDETLDYSYERQLESLQNVKRGVADVVTAKKRLEIQTQSLQTNVDKLEGQAREAVASGRDDLARLALERKSVAQTQVTNLNGQVARLQDQQDKLVAAEQQAEARIEAFRNEKEVIKAQYSAAEAQVRIGEAATGIGNELENTGLAIQRAKDKSDQMQARASALEELTEAGTFEDFTSSDTKLDRELAQVSQSGAIDADLARLKKEVGPGEKAKAIES